MSAGGAFGGNRGARPVPPEKGVFPLDHMLLCDLEKKDYIKCLKSSGHKSENCRNFSKRNLMAKQELSELGFGQKTSEEYMYEKKTFCEVYSLDD
ncbi:uncharacterized protein LOC142520503 isoform X2 [Primulina tabacum]|uniref:uncharacterized protein LOC142520503 isoform X2 n=1 Tax=Primulina tabacum TaxID=48773 RepID=UPI003F5929C1